MYYFLQALGCDTDMTELKPTGSQETRQFYDNIGWQEEFGQSVDNRLFGAKEDGPIRQALHNVHTWRVRSALARAGESLKLLECGCGGNPATELLDLCSTYNGVDFSAAGLELARKKLQGMAIPCDVDQADVCQLPFATGSFDAVYSAHMLYHIPDPEAQRMALREMMRVIKPSGVLVLLTANPRPLLFPIRALKRLIADVPALKKLANSVRRQPPLPYQPMPLSWMRAQLSPVGSVNFVAYGLPSTAFYQQVTERKGLGKQLWKGLKWLDINYPKASAYLGNYVQVTVVKSLVV